MGFSFLSCGFEARYTQTDTGLHDAMKSCRLRSDVPEVRAVQKASDDADIRQVALL